MIRAVAIQQPMSDSESSPKDRERPRKCHASLPFVPCHPKVDPVCCSGLQALQGAWEKSKPCQKPQKKGPECTSLIPALHSSIICAIAAMKCQQWHFQAAFSGSRVSCGTCILMMPVRSLKFATSSPHKPWITLQKRPHSSTQGCRLNKHLNTQNENANQQNKYRHCSPAPPENRRPSTTAASFPLSCNAMLGANFSRMCYAANKRENERTAMLPPRVRRLPKLAKPTTDRPHWDNAKEV